MTVVERGVGGEMSQLWNKFSSAQRSDELPRNPSIHLNKSYIGNLVGKLLKCPIDFKCKLFSDKFS